MKDFREAKALAASFAIGAMLASGATQAAIIVANIQFDPDNGTLTINAGGTPHDGFESGLIPINSVVAVGDSLRLNVSFVDTATNMPQTIVMQQEGLGFPYPTTFGSIIDPGNHNFGPSLVLGGNSTPSAADGTLMPTLTAGLLNGDYTGATGAAACGANFCLFPVVFPDFIDGNTEVELSGFTADISLTLTQETTFNSVQFRLMAPGIQITQVPEPGTLALLGLGLAGLAATRRRKR